MMMHLSPREQLLPANKQPNNCVQSSRRYLQHAVVTLELLYLLNLQTFPMSRRPDSWRLRPLDRVIWNHITDSLKEDSFWDSSAATDLNMVGGGVIWSVVGIHFVKRVVGKQGNASGFACTWAPPPPTGLNAASSGQVGHSPKRDGALQPKQIYTISHTPTQTNNKSQSFSSWHPN